MSKKRYFDTKFWSDSYASRLDPVEKLLFIYLITNERTNVAGIYELPNKIMSVETGIESSMLETVLGRFMRDGKIVLFDGWVRIVNAAKHQNLENKNILKGIENVYRSIPNNIKDGLRLPNEHEEFLELRGSDKTVEESSRVSNNLDLDFNLDLDLLKANKSPVKKKVDKPVDEVSKLYYEAIKELQLPVRNHTHLKGRIKSLEKDIGKDKALAYLNFLKSHYKKLDDDGFKPRLTEGLDIYAKRLNIQSWIERKVIEQTKPANTGGRPII